LIGDAFRRADLNLVLNRLQLLETLEACREQPLRELCERLLSTGIRVVADFREQPLRARASTLLEVSHPWLVPEDLSSIRELVARTGLLNRPIFGAPQQSCHPLQVVGVYADAGILPSGVVLLQFDFCKGESVGSGRRTC